MVKYSEDYWCSHQGLCCEVKEDIKRDFTLGYGAVSFTSFGNGCSLITYSLTLSANMTRTGAYWSSGRLNNHVFQLLLQIELITKF